MHFNGGRGKYKTSFCTTFSLKGTTHQKPFFVCDTVPFKLSFFKYSLIPSGALFAEYDLIFEKKAEEKELISFGSEKNSSTKIYKRLYTFI